MPPPIRRPREGPLDPNLVGRRVEVRITEREVLAVALDTDRRAGLVRAGVLALDSTKIVADASGLANRTYEQIAREIIAEGIVGRDPEHPAAIDIRRRLGQRAHHLQLVGEPVVDGWFAKANARTHKLDFQDQPAAAARQRTHAVAAPRV